ncbi:hypothetical protein [Plasticicumulans acidivorans]|uniref:Uncharacterized protein n=1 Tax=Plasticicumulans acidivorans TaxID=886464 RepID=A0A317MR90_9GAMM|nr:hypothetical protein [Plasticicumulans acidivorans]PWV59044.1 hypothetical protein C7443_11242 [Plasticicumulans acidivorans]
MHKRLLAIVAPPIAIARHGGHAAWCAAPIGTVWMSALVGIGIGLQGDLNSDGREVMTWVVALGVAIWAIAAAWAQLVISGVDDDSAHEPDSTFDHTVYLSGDEPDPLEQIRGMR